MVEVSWSGAQHERQTGRGTDLQLVQGTHMSTCEGHTFLGAGGGILALPCVLCAWDWPGGYLSVGVCAGIC